MKLCLTHPLFKCLCLFLQILIQDCSFIVSNFPFSLHLLCSLGHCSSTGTALSPGSGTRPAGGGFMGDSGTPAPSHTILQMLAQGGQSGNPPSNQRERNFSRWLGRHVKGNLAIDCHRGAGQRLDEKYSLKPSLPHPLYLGPHPIYLPVIGFF